MFFVLDEAWMYVPCPLSSITKLMAESVANNFQMVFDYVYDVNANFSDTMTAMLKKFALDAYRVSFCINHVLALAGHMVNSFEYNICEFSFQIGLGVHPDERNKRVAIMAWNTCAYTIMTTGKL